MSPHDWTNLPKKSSCKRFSLNTPLFLFGSLEMLKNTFFLTGWMEERMAFVTMKTEGGSSISSQPFLLEKLHLFFLYFFGLILLVFGYLRNTIKSLKPTRVGASLTWTNIPKTPNFYRWVIWISSTFIELKLKERSLKVGFCFNFVAESFNFAMWWVMVQSSKWSWGMSSLLMLRTSKFNKREGNQRKANC